MGKKQKVSVSEQDGVQYNRARVWQIATAMLFGAAQMCFYILLSYATYIGTENFGVAVAVTGIIITVSRIFDGITDPICAYVIERFNCRFGKIRIFMMAGSGLLWRLPLPCCVTGEPVV